MYPYLYLFIYLILALVCFHSQGLLFTLLNDSFCNSQLCCWNNKKLVLQLSVKELTNYYSHRTSVDHKTFQSKMAEYFWFAFLLYSTRLLSSCWHKSKKLWFITTQTQSHRAAGELLSSLVPRPDRVASVHSKKMNNSVLVRLLHLWSPASSSEISVSCSWFYEKVISKIKTSWIHSCLHFLILFFPL